MLWYYQVNDRFEYPEEIDLSPFVVTEPGATSGKDSSNLNSKSGLWVYKLHTAIVHAGTTSGGAYHAYIKPGSNLGDGEWWMKFADERVHKVPEREVFEGSFGDGSESVGKGNAYVLIYVRKSDWGRVVG